MRNIKDASLKNYSGFKTGGRAELLVKIHSVKDLKELFRNIGKESYHVIGKGFNTLIGAEPIKMPVIVLEGDFEEITSRGTQITAGAGAWLAEIVKKSAASSLGGLEFLSSIPGSAAGAVKKNCGAFGKTTAQAVKEVEVFDTGSLRHKKLSSSEAGFGYRKCGLDKGMLITGVKYSLKSENKSDIIRKIKENAASKAAAQPLDKRSCGCVFKNPPSGPPAGKLIEKAGLKGFRTGGAQVSEKHANYIIAREGASSDDILKLIKEIKNALREKFSIELEPEIDFLGCGSEDEDV